MDVKQGLCFRCEHRACFYETGSGPRCECQGHETAVYSCYMYKPVRPVVLKRNRDDRRPQFAGSMISARSHFVKIADSELALKSGREGGVLYWTPKNLTKRKKTDRYDLLREK